ncbi:MAG: hypothetical protein QM504_18580 [Pseudomonadota bacterium]
MNIKKLLTFIIVSFFSVLFLAEKALAEKALVEKTAVLADVQTWQTVEHGVTFSLRQILSDQVNAFYIGRGFTINQIKAYAKTCVYTTILRNDKALGRIHYVRNNWSIINKGKSQKIRKNSDWLSELKQKNVKASALIAFRFAQFPQEQEYDPNGDWNQGMLSINLPVGSQFDIIVRWDIKGKPYELKLSEVNCIE